MSTGVNRSEQASVAQAGTKFMSYWLDNEDRPKAEPALDHEVACDLLIEGQEVATGASGRPTGILSMSVMHGIDNTERMFPDGGKT